MNLTSNLHLNLKRTYEIFEYFVSVNNALNEEHRYKLKGSHQKTFYGVVSYYNKQLQRVDRFKTLRRSVQIEDLPLFETNIGNLRSAAGASSVDTVRNHRKRLLATGLFWEEHHVQCRGLMISLCPIFFLDMDQLVDYKPVVDKYVKAVISARKAAEQKGANFDAKAVLLSIFDTNIRKVLKEDNNKPVNNSPNTQIGAQVTSLKSGSPNGALPSESKERKYQSDGKKAAGPEKKERLRNAIRPTENKKENSAGAAPAAAIFYLPLIRQFWAYVAGRLYPGKTFSEEKTRKILNLLYLVYFRNSAKLTEDQYIDFYSSCVERVEIAAQYFARRPQLFVPDPEYYFSPPSRDEYERKTEFKFYKTHDFLTQKQFKLAFWQVRQEVAAWRKRKGRHRNKSLLQLYEIHRCRLLGFNNSSGMKQFYTVAGTLYSMAARKRE